jgi:hypothetical protein
MLKRGANRSTMKNKDNAKNISMKNTASVKSNLPVKPSSTLVRKPIADKPTTNQHENIDQSALVKPIVDETATNPTENIDQSALVKPIVDETATNPTENIDQSALVKPIVDETVTDGEKKVVDYKIKYFIAKNDKLLYILLSDDDMPFTDKNRPLYFDTIKQIDTELNMNNIQNDNKITIDNEDNTKIYMYYVLTDTIHGILDDPKYIIKKIDIENDKATIQVDEETFIKLLNNVKSKKLNFNDVVSFNKKEYDHIRNNDENIPVIPKIKGLYNKYNYLKKQINETEQSISNIKNEKGKPTPEKTKKLQELQKLLEEQRKNIAEIKNDLFNELNKSKHNVDNIDDIDNINLNSILINFVNKDYISDIGEKSRIVEVIDIYKNNEMENIMTNSTSAASISDKEYDYSDKSFNQKLEYANKVYESFLKITSKTILLDPYIFKIGSLSIDDFMDSNIEPVIKNALIRIFYIDITPICANNFEKNEIKFERIDGFYTLYYFLLLNLNNLTFQENAVSISSEDIQIAKNDILKFTKFVNTALKQQPKDVKYIHINNFIRTCKMILINAEKSWDIHVLDILIEYCKYIINTYIDVYNTIFNYFSMKEHYTDVILKINEKIKSVSNKNIITYIKLTNFEDKKTNKYSERFNIKMNNYSLIVNYNDHNIPYYKKISINDKVEFINSDELPKYLGYDFKKESKIYMINEKLKKYYNNDFSDLKNGNDKRVQEAAIKALENEKNKENERVFIEYINSLETFITDIKNNNYSSIRNYTNMTIYKVAIASNKDSNKPANKEKKISTNIDSFKYIAYISEIYKRFLEKNNLFIDKFTNRLDKENIKDEVKIGIEIINNGDYGNRKIDNVIKEIKQKYEERKPKMILYLKKMINYAEQIFNKNKRNNYLYGDDFQNYFNITQKNLLENVFKYDSKYVFGKFTKVFAPSQTNDSIASEMNDIISKVNEHKPVFLIGYGASGAGKTSTLIYNNKQKTPGILVEICNILCNQHGNGLPEYSKIDLLVKEYYITKIGEKEKCNDAQNKRDDPYICSENTYNFTVQNQNIVLDGDFDSVPKHSYRVDKLKRLHLIEDDVGKTFGEIMMYLVDSDRYVKATTNNPNSSRSHTLIFVKLISNDNKRENNGHIVVGDFAGVENVFTCENYETINAFLNQTRDGDTELPYYSSEEDEIAFANFGDNSKYLSGKSVIDIDGFNSKMKGFKDMIANQQNVSTLPDIFKNKNNTNNSFIENWEKILPTVQKHNHRETLDLVTKNKESINRYENMERDYLNLLEKYLQNKYITNDKVNNSGVILLKRVYSASSIYYINNYIDPSKSNKKPVNLTMETGNLRPLSEYTTKIDNMKKFIKIFLQIYIGDIIEKFREKQIVSDIIINTGNKNKINPDKNDIFTNKYVEIFDEANKNKPIYKEIIQRLLSKYNIDQTIDDFNGIQIIDTYQKAQDDIYGTNFYNLLDIKNYKPDNNDNKYIDMITNFIEYMNEIYYRYKYGKIICENRREEGYFINQSLKDIRITIKQIMDIKNTGNLYNSPDYFDICLKQYCKTNIDCFTNVDSLFKTTPKKNEDIPSILFREIFNHYKGEIYTGEESKEIKRFYKDILISVICVFNTSRIANNPPPIPYLDINRFKQIYYQYEKYDDISLRQEFLNELKKIYVKVTGNKYDFVIDKEIPIYKTFKNKLNSLSIDSKFKQIYNTDVEVVDAAIGIINNTNKAYNNDDKKEIEDFIELINNSNAASTIGTLQYIDELSKFNVVNNVCLNIDENKLLDNFIELYSKTYMDNYMKTSNITTNEAIDVEEEVNEFDEEDGV